MRSITLLSPAKVNLFLHVLDRRPDGYHDVVTLFHRVSLCDQLSLKKLRSDHVKFRLITNHPKLTVTRENLIYRAYQLLCKTASWKGGIQVSLKKNVPIGAGLGGGSSNAAFFLMGMNQLFGLGLPKVTLLRLGAQLGSDVPFFLHDLNQAIGTGRGECVQPIPFQRQAWFVLVVPSFSISTRLAYQSFARRRRSKTRLRLTRISRADTITSVLLKHLESGRTSGFFQNDLFRISCSIRPELGRICALFEGLGIQPVMSGSGSTIFSMHRSKQEAEDVARQIRHRKLKAEVFICHTF